MARQLRRDEYTVGWVCALHVELAAAQEMLDEKHSTPPSDAHDSNIYTCGRIGEHNVVIACLPEGIIGTSSAAAVALQMKLAFTSTRFGLMVGIGGGVPSKEVDIRLGDVVVSKPNKTHGGVVQYDSGKATLSGFERTGSLSSPPHILLNAVAKVAANKLRGRSLFSTHVSKLELNDTFQRVKAGPDVLFEAAYDHSGGPTCDQCNVDRQEARQPRKSGEEVVVHCGTFASGNQVIRSAAERDKVSNELGGVLCFEMEAAGLMNSFPCLVIRGICDYADSHKNKRWQAYAAGAAAAYAKEVLSVIPPADLVEIRAVDETYLGHVDYLRLCKQALSRKEWPSRQDEIKTFVPPHWLFQDAIFREWANPSQSGSGTDALLILKGGPGTGKSVLIKEAAMQAERFDTVVLRYYFTRANKALDSISENALYRLYTSLLYQLLDKLEPKPWPFLNQWGPLLHTDPHVEPWDLAQLRGAVEEVIFGYGERPAVAIRIFIDALDECYADPYESQPQQPLEVLRGISTLLDGAARVGVDVRACLSRRHTPAYDRQEPKSLTLIVEEHNGSAIEAFVTTE